MVSMKLRRVAYHGGALIGPDICKIQLKPNYTKIANVFSLKSIKTSDLEAKVYSSLELRQKILTLFKKFSECYVLMTADRPLCKHEVEILAIRCVSLGNWFPINFPDENLKRKFHRIVFHIPEKARKRFTCGMETEQLTESIYPFFNRIARIYLTVRNPQQWLALEIRTQWHSSSDKVSNI